MAKLHNFIVQVIAMNVVRQTDLKCAASVKYDASVNSSNIRSERGYIGCHNFDG